MRTSLLRHAITIAVGAALLLGTPANAQQGTKLVVRNNHEIPFSGPIDLTTDLADGRYAGPLATADVRSGRAHVVASLAPKSEVILTRTGAPAGGLFAAGPMSVRETSSSLTLRFKDRQAADVAMGLVVLPGSNANADSAIKAFTSLPFSWKTAPDGEMQASVEKNGFIVNVSARPYGGGWLDVRTNVVTRTALAGPAYVALVRRVVTPAAHETNIRFNGRVLSGGDSPGIWEGDFRYVHGVDWMQWKTGGLSLLSVNGFTPVPSVKHDTTWAEGSSFYVRERTRQSGDTMYLVAEIAGPNADQPKKGYMAVLPYASPVAGDTVALKWRLSIDPSPAQTWAESQLREFAGTRSAVRDGATVRAAIGVPYTLFGMAYFPYSTFTENFDFYRVPGMTSENFWPTSAAMWKQWRQFEPRMRTDMHIIRAMGFDVLRLHHLELLQTLPRAEAFAFLDFYANEARSLGFKMMIDTEGPAEWVSAIVGRYKDLVIRVELENEVLIPGITPAEPARWKSLYAAAKAAAPNADVFFTGAGNNSMFERLKTLGVPFDRVGLHAYKHGPNWKEAWSSHALGTAGYATEQNKPMTLGEFNWKDLTLLSPESRPAEWATIYENVLATRSVQDIIQFQFQESIAFNTTVGGTKSRHYEPVGIDRTPKPEAFVAMKLMREYGRPDAPVKVLPVQIDPVRFVNGKAEATFTVSNETGAAQTVSVQAMAFDGTETRLLTPVTLNLPAGSSKSGRVALSLAQGGKPGAYHHFVSARYKDGTSLGWGVVSNEGPPQFADSSVLGSKVTYAQGRDVVRSIKWERPLAVTFGDKASALEVEEAFQLKNTLQAATGRYVRVSSEKDLTDSLAKRGTVFVIGTAATSTLVAETRTPVEADKGTIALHREGGREWVVLAGVDAKGAEAAVAELELRYWPNAKDATIRITGIEKGKALGNSAGGSTIDPP
ncbi:MAG: hypothetical protein JWM95_2084 [Gemmatimonadetes bacterium]|nr:hypothetical protein [Gemmatimonadota bacterium]